MHLLAIYQDPPLRSHCQFIMVPEIIQNSRNGFQSKNNHQGSQIQKEIVANDEEGYEQGVD